MARHSARLPPAALSRDDHLRQLRVSDSEVVQIGSRLTHDPGDPAVLARRLRHLFFPGESGAEYRDSCRKTAAVALPPLRPFFCFTRFVSTSPSSDSAGM